MDKPLKLVASLALASALAGVALAPRAARAEVHVNIDIGLPVAPPLVAVQPGVQVVENWNEEVYFVSGWYWVRRDGGWYRARRPHAAFAWCEPRRVPVALVRMPPGQYVRYQRHARNEERKEWKRERKEWKEQEKHERKHGHGHDKHGDHDD
jgi:hypothetical protein